MYRRQIFIFIQLAGGKVEVAFSFEERGSIATLRKKNKS